MTNEEPLFEIIRPAWQARSNCHPRVIPHVWQPFGDAPVDLFFPDQHLTGPQRRAIATVCGPCPVQQECRQWAVEHEIQGFWGGGSQVAIKQERKAQGLKVVTPEVDPRTRLVIGTFDTPGHGTAERYQQHMRGQMADNNPCEACLDAWSERRRHEHEEAYRAKRRAEAPEAKADRLARDRVRTAVAREKARRGG